VGVQTWVEQRLFVFICGLGTGHNVDIIGSSALRQEGCGNKAQHKHNARRRDQQARFRIPRACLTANDR
jgi:hypothetical protein